MKINTNGSAKNLKNIYIVMKLVIVVIVILLIAIYYKLIIWPKYHPSLDIRAPDYLKFTMVESPDNNFGNKKEYENNILKLTEYCNGMANCHGFNTQGFFKDKILSEHKWQTILDPKFALYVKIYP